ncbi:MAG: recombinase family protein [Mycobacteriaceae bacterium]
MAERPGLAGALAACLEHGAAVLLVEERTRLARDEYAAHDALRTFAHAGVKVLYADGSNGNDASDPAAMLLDGIGHAVAAYDRRVIVARMAAGRQSKAQREPRSRAQGGKLPYGYRRSRSGGVEVDPEAAAQVRRASILCVVEPRFEPRQPSLADIRRWWLVSSSGPSTSGRASGGSWTPGSGMTFRTHSGTDASRVSGGFPALSASM